MLKTSEEIIAMEISKALSNLKYEITGHDVLKIISKYCGVND